LERVIVVTEQLVVSVYLICKSAFLDKREYYCTVLDEFYWGLTVVGKFELITQFQDEVLFNPAVSVQILFDCPRDVAISLHDYFIELILLKKEW
jgi:hypothetical protein